MELMIPGPVGALQAEINEAAGGGRLAVLCHPHPLYGGTMDDYVLGLLAEELAASGCTTLKFNFRGVGGSDGHHSGSGGELDDLNAVLDWVGVNRPDAELILGGYSFGAATVSQALPGASASRALLIAPPAGNLGTLEPDGRIPTDVFAGSADAFVDAGAIGAWQHARVHVIEGADHFFAGHGETLRADIRQALAEP